MTKRVAGLVRLGVLVAALSAVGCERAAPPSAPAQSPPAASGSIAATAAEHAHDAPAPTPVSEAPPKVPVLEQQVAYGEAGKRNLVGFLAMPQDAAEPLPGVIVIHEWWGLNDNIKAITRRIAGEGYVALAVDLYDGATADAPEKAQALMSTLVADPAAARANLGQAYAYLDKYALAPRIATIGWCLGGGYSLQTALMLPDDVDAMVMYYGALVDDESALSRLRMPVLGFFGGLDESIPVRDVQRFRESLLKLGKPAEILIYPNAKHAFANPSGGNYDATAASESWQKTLAFLEENLRPKPR